MRLPSRCAAIRIDYLCAVVPELPGNLEERNFECLWIGAYVAAPYRSSHVRQLDMELLSELVTQPVRRHTELLPGNASLLHHVVEALERLFQRQAWMSQMRRRVQ